MKRTKTKNSFLIVFITLIIFSSCSHKVLRTGYTLSKAEQVQCEIPIKKFISIADEDGQKLGEIKLKDSGVSVSCNEQKAIEILRGEACALKANLIVITEETRSNSGSTCYRCTASFYRLNSDNIESPIISDRDFSDQEVQKRTMEDKKKNRTSFWTAFAVGFVIGFIAFL